MSININVNGMSYLGESYAQRAEREKRCKNRLLKVREQSKDIAQGIRDKVRIAKQEELKELQKIREKELAEWKRKRQCQLENQIDCGMRDFANAHIAALDASCEESESLREARQEQDLMAAVRGRVAMLQEQRKRDKEAEDRLVKKKRQQQKTIGIQADFLTQRAFSENRNINIQIGNSNSSEDEQEVQDVPRYTSKPNIHKTTVDYNPQNYTSNSVDSSNNGESEDEPEELIKDAAETEFNQITNLLKQKMQEIYDAPYRKIAEEREKVVIISSSDSSDVEIVPVSTVLKNKSATTTTTRKSSSERTPQKAKGILKTKKSPSKSKVNAKKSSSPQKKSKTAENNRVRYMDFNTQNQTSYVPNDDLVTRNEPTRSMNARDEAQIRNNPLSTKINDDVLRQLNEIRSYEALEKEKIRRDYERLRLEMEELSNQEQELRSKTNRNRLISRDQLLRKEENRQKKMNKAVENAIEKNIITCPPVARGTEKLSSPAYDLNVAAPNAQVKSTEINNLVKIERLKDLLEKINHQKRLILNELEKGDDNNVPGPDLEKVMESLKKLEKEKAALDAENKEKLNKFKELNEREQKVREREIRLENKLRDLFKKQQQKENNTSPSTSSPTSTSETSSDTKKIIAPPVEIIIKVQPTKSPRKKSKKSIRCLDTLSREPGKVYPKTPIKRKSKELDENIAQEEVSKPPSTNTKIDQAPSVRPILKKTTTINDNSSSTSYRSLPEEIVDVNPQVSQQPMSSFSTSRKDHHKLNPTLMHYITRLLGMSTNIGNQLNVDVSSVATPGSSTINTSGNNSAILVEPLFDANRMEKLQQFIDDNYTFLNEINETLESAEQEQINDKRMEGIWRDALYKKKPPSVVSRASKSVKEAAEREQIGGSVVSGKGSKTSQMTAKVVDKGSSVVSEQTTIKSKPALKINPQLQQIIPQRRREITPNEMMKITRHLEDDMLNSYAANCKKKIAELNRMMEQVRQEKLKIIENSLSSGEFNNFTEYRELQIQGTKATSSEQKDSSQREDPPSEEINNILQRQTRSFGVSKDSGLSTTSRPVTSSDFRDSPDVRVTSEETAANVFQPIAKAPKIKIVTPDEESETIKDVSQVIRQQQKTQRPPLSLKSFSPQAEKQQHEPHELSTIAEIETPTGTKINIAIDETNIGVTSHIHSFPDFDQYAKDIGEHHVTIEEQPFPDLGDLQGALPDIHMKTYVDPQDFNLGERDEDAVSNDSSLMDIMEEVKRRKIFNHSLEMQNENAPAFRDERTTPTTTVKVLQPQSPRRPPPQSRIIIKTPEKAGNVQVEILQTPIKRRQPPVEVPQPESPNSNDTLNGIKEIENDFQGAGLSWAASLLKRSEEAKKLRDKSSSSSEKVEIEIELPESSASSNGKPMNLRDFLRRELMEKSKKDKYLSDTSSLSSQFMRSLLNASTGSTASDKQHRSDESSSQNAKLRTSTPVNMKSTDRMTTTGKNTAVSSSQQLFGMGAESVSTVRDSGASGSDKSGK